MSLLQKPRLPFSPAGGERQILTRRCRPQSPKTQCPTVSESLSATRLERTHQDLLLLVTPIGQYEMELRQLITYVTYIWHASSSLQ
jgi:hypothetical protein